MQARAAAAQGGALEAEKSPRPPLAARRSAVYLRIVRNTAAPPLRLALKTGAYSLTHFTVAITVTFLITQDWRPALAVGLIEPLVQTFAYALRERAWSAAGKRRVTSAG